MSRPAAILVLGLGNALCSDDGVGVAAVHALTRHFELPDNVRAVDGGTLGLDLLTLVADADHVILIDAVRADAPPGTRLRLSGDDVPPAVYERLSPHQLGVADLLAGAALIDRYPSSVVLLGVVPTTTELGLGRSHAVEDSLPRLVVDVVAELISLDATPRPRGTGRARPHPDPLVRTLHPTESSGGGM